MKFAGAAHRSSPDAVPFRVTVVVGVLMIGFLSGWALAGEYWIVLGGLGILAAIPIIVRWPVVTTFGIYALLATSLDTLPLLTAGASLTKPVGVLAGGVLLAAGLVERRLVRPPREALFWGGLLVWAVISTGWALDPSVTIRRLPTILSLFFLYLAAVSFRPSRKEFEWVCALTVIGGALAAGLGYMFGLTENAVGTAARGRLVIGDLQSNPNALGRLLILPLALAIAAFVGLRTTLQRIAAIGLMILIGLGIFISMSRGAIAATMVMLSVLIYRARARSKILVAVMLLVALSATLIPPKFYERLGERLGMVLSGEDATGSGRTEIWIVAVKSLERFGILGAGLGNFDEMYRRDVFFQGAVGAHNIYLMVWVELGIVGLIIMIIAIATHLSAARNARKRGHGGPASRAVEAACIGILVASAFSDQLWTKTFWLAWTLLAWSNSYEEQHGELSGEEPEERTG